MTSSRKTPAVVAVIALLLCGGMARADDATELERAKTSYDAGRYAEGADRFREMLNQDSPNALHSANAIERARAYYAACLIALGRTDEANEQFEKLLRSDPRYRLDPVVFPGEVINRFIDVKARLSSEIEAADRVRTEARAKAEREQRAYISNLQRLASQESVVVQHSRWVAAVPFGVGQFQNGQEGLGFAFLIGEAILAGTSITAGVIHMQLIADYSRAPTSVNYDDFVSRKNATLDLSIYSSAALAVIALGGIIQAEATFVPQVREIRTRPIPQPPRVLPAVGLAPSGFTLGLEGRF
jgi:tetratricopeptide (TPR) repeat protein